MVSRNYLFTSESVTEGHPDKLADQISDGVLDAILREDPRARVACETTLTTGLCLIAGEITTSARIDYAGVARATMRKIGYTRAAYGLDSDTCGVLTSITEQSPDIAQGVGTTEQLGAGDQGLMFGFATDESEGFEQTKGAFMPLPILLAHNLARRLAEARHKGQLSYLRPDGKSQVTLEYRDGKPARADGIVIAAQHDEDVKIEQLREDIRREVIGRVVPPSFLDANTKYYINQTGRFVRGGPYADTGLTGRKIIVDTYGGSAPHGGGAFSGKDPTKVDRSACYAARWAAKNVVAAGLARKCQIQLAYVIGHAKPMNVYVDTFGTGVVPDADLEQRVAQLFDFSPAGIIKALDLRKPVYQQVASYGHFGRTDLQLTWEKLDRVQELRKHFPGTKFLREA
ncbi:MAG TPA: methionine adenosyltransferase [Candidatus Thermoplasmatota archaeon]|jgi:S-adenosylmethionine synthetase|nr:methionine adenosyltransferase [Candidatus Thermoplasmatota archaeon]